MKALVIITALLISCIATVAHTQMTTTTNATMKKVTVFFTGAQIQHESQLDLQAGKQEIIFEKLTDFVDPNTVQVKAIGDLTILSVRTRKNYEDLKIGSEQMKNLNEKRKSLKANDGKLRDEYTILETDKNLLMRNRDLKGNNDGLKISELKEAYDFMHQKLSEITTRQSAIESELEDLQKKMNQLEQEIISQRSKPVINYSEIVVEIDVEKPTAASFVFNYISPRATWKPYYDMRSDGIGKPVRLEAKANVSQTTGIEWNNVDMVLSTNDPYQNAQEPIISPWKIYCNNQPQTFRQAPRSIPATDFSGEKIRGEVIDASTGEPMPFTKVAFYTNSAINTVTDFDGKFEITVPKGESYLNASYVGFNNQSLFISAAYLKFFMVPIGLDLSDLQVKEYEEVLTGVFYQSDRDENYAGFSYDSISTSAIEKTVFTMKKNMNSKRTSGRKVACDAYGNPIGDNDKLEKKFKEGKNGEGRYQEIDAKIAGSAKIISTKKDLRVEYSIVSKMSIPTDGMDHRVSIAAYDLNANYEYHVIPKMDASVYLAAQVTGWEKLNLMSGESNIYFDGTFMGKSYLDVNSTKDTLSFSFGKDNKISVDRTRIKEKSSSNTIGKRQKFEVTWEIKIKNNGAAMIPLIVKDQYPISNYKDIKVKQGELVNGKIEKNTAIISWSFKNGITGSETLNFNYKVDYRKGRTLYLE
jgi:hypothetical protein